MVTRTEVGLAPLVPENDAEFVPLILCSIGELDSIVFRDDAELISIALDDSADIELPASNHDPELASFGIVLIEGLELDSLVDGVVTGLVSLVYNDSAEIESLKLNLGIGSFALGDTTKLDSLVTCNRFGLNSLISKACIGVDPVNTS